MGKVGSWRKDKSGVGILPTVVRGDGEIAAASSSLIVLQKYA
jgi:hypothetical protein